jgi:hypothetical protein
VTFLLLHDAKIMNTRPEIARISDWANLKRIVILNIEEYL